MKKLMIATLLMLVSTSSFAWQVRANLYVNRTFVQAGVYNQWNRPIICSGNLTGFTYHGRMANAYINNIVIYPGMWANMNIYTNNYDPFVNQRANVNCNWYY